jgi:hypothetical protein
MVGEAVDSVVVVVNVTDGAPSVDTVRIFVPPAISLNIQLPTVAIPFEPVCTFPETEALPGVTEKETVTPLTGLPKISFTVTLGSGVTAALTGYEGATSLFLII